MNKIWLIIKREYLTRVKKRSFILSTILTPLLFAGVIGIIIFITVRNSDKEKIAVVDNTGVFTNKIDSSKSIKFFLDPTVDTSNFEKKGYTAILYSPNTGINTSDKWRVFAKKNFGIMVNDEVNKKLSTAYENSQLIKTYNINIDKIDSIRKDSKNLTAEPGIIGKNATVAQGNSLAAYMVGYGASFLIYITLIIYGTMVMRGVMEEKTNRIAEVMVSSVRPFQLMMGKIIGIGAVGLTQFLMWIILVSVFSSIIGALIPHEIIQQAAEANKNIPGQMGGNMQGNQALVGFLSETNKLSASVNIWLIVGSFLFYFLFGYLFYSALFAAVGSAVNEDPQDAQTLMFPITMPIILAIIIMINAITHPESGLATWSSIIPFFSPIVMMARIPFGVPGTVPYWQLGLSMLLLVAGFLVTTWASAKIYRTGILLYGKKITWKEMWKWAFRTS